MVLEAPSYPCDMDICGAMGRWEHVGKQGLRGAARTGADLQLFLPSQCPAVTPKFSAMLLCRAPPFTVPMLCWKWFPLLLLWELKSCGHGVDVELAQGVTGAGKTGDAAGWCRQEIHVLDGETIPINLPYPWAELAQSTMSFSGDSGLDTSPVTTLWGGSLCLFTALDPSC